MSKSLPKFSDFILQLISENRQSVPLHCVAFFVEVKQVKSEFLSHFFHFLFSPPNIGQVSLHRDSLQLSSNTLLVPLRIHQTDNHLKYDLKN